MELTLLLLLQLLSIFAAAVLILGLIFIKITTNDVTPVIGRYDCEKIFKDPATGEKQKFPFLDDKSSILLSVVVPSYNEESRLPVMLTETCDYLEKREKNDPAFTYEIIVVDDGSKDKTTEVALNFARERKSSNIRVLTFKKNRGKGGAVRMGVLSSRGEKILMVDADGATKFEDLDSVEKALDDLKGGRNGMAVSVGSRAHLQDDAVAQRNWLRNILMYGFHFLVFFLCVKGIKDTQCGFKLFTRKAALRLFSCLHVERWAFDVELLYIAQCLGIPIAEVAVNWQEIDGSKMIPIFSWLQMGKDLLLIRLRYVISAWKIAEGPATVIDLK
ncbi:dolichyl-phosphate beta-glucosyltransferase-like [Rhopilema esculentum]|uniref:dolichyl-phosphate beta-glucosyltransferase-like n=1 Tax=Rhopilema esculentum TaxID=499914 RepID=UPI0031D79E80|eukprot:gene489-10167_t